MKKKPPSKDHQINHSARAELHSSLYGFVGGGGGLTAASLQTVELWWVVTPVKGAQLEDCLGKAGT